MTTAPGTHLITGAGSGIGAAVARRLHDRGDRLVLLARNAARAGELRDEFAGAAVVVADLADPVGLQQQLSGQQLPASIDSLLHVAGTIDLGPVAELPAVAWQQQLTINLLAPAELTRILLPALRAARGRVVFVNSGAGLNARPDWAAYAASKHGLRALADSLRQEEHANGVRVTSVYPGRTATPMQQKVHEQEGRRYRADDFTAPDSVASTILLAIDLPPDADLTDLTVRPGR